jgi:P-type E1-E2 ATPase
VGDGANDALALASASVGVAASGGVELSLKACDIYLTTPGLKSLAQLLWMSKHSMKIVKRNLWLSLSYNSISVVLAFMGLIHPLLAAIIMPTSSLTVLVSSLLGTQQLRKKWK